VNFVPPVSSKAPVRGTQLLVSHMGEVLKRPSLIAIEVGWRWIVGVPFLLVLQHEANKILAAYPLSASGFDTLDAMNPWVAAVQFAGIWSYYQAPVAALLHWLLPAYAVAWIIASALGRNLILRLLAPSSDAAKRLPFRPFSMIALQAAWTALLALTLWGWYRAIQWTADTHITVNAEPDLIGYAVWAIFLTLGIFTAWALLSWVFSIAPLLMLLERRSALSALGQSFRLGRVFSGKLAEINLVLGIAKLALMVVSMVISAAPLPFSDQLGSDTLHFIGAASVIFYLLANDYFQVVRLRAFVEFWRILRVQ